MVSGGTQWPAPGYHDGFQRAGGIEVAATSATKGDVIQVGNADTDSPLHTAIIVQNLGSGRFNVIDSNFNWNETVTQHDWTPPAGAKFWRMGGESRNPGMPAPLSQLDLLAQENHGNGVHYMVGRSNGDGTFRWGYSNLTNYARPHITRAGDIDGDSDADIVALETHWADGPRYMVGFSGGNSIFAWQSSNLRNYAKARDFQMGDIDGDGDDDIVAIENTSQGVTYRIGFSQRNGNFTWHTTNLRDYAVPSHMRVGDVGGDGKADIVTMETWWPDGPRYMVGVSHGDGNFDWRSSNLRNYTVPKDFQMGDVNGDGQDDIVATEPADAKVTYTVGFATGNATFRWATTNLQHWATPTFMRVGDVTGDGKADIVAQELWNGSARYMVGRSGGDGVFVWSATNLQYWAVPHDFQVANVRSR